MKRYVARAPGELPVRRGACKLALELLEDRQLLSTITVNTTDDGDVITETSTTLSLRQAIELSNGTLAYTSLTPAQQALVSSPPVPGVLNTVDFNIPGPAPHTIQVGSSASKPGAALPVITNPVVIDGTSEPAFDPLNPVPLIELNGALAGTSAEGLRINAGNSTIRGLDIDHFSAHGIFIVSAGNLITGNYVGIDPSGTQKAGNGSAGIGVYGSNNTIGGSAAGAGNVISGNAAEGVFIPAGGNLVEGNLIGLNATGSTGIGNGLSGITLNDSGGNTILGNTISGNGATIPPGGDGIVIIGPHATRNLVQGNSIGTDISGTKAIPNSGGGVGIVNASNNAIGGPSTTEGNVISGNGHDGLLIERLVSAGGGGSTPTSNLVENNFIGTDRKGDPSLGNANNGVLISLSDANTVSGNVMSGNGGAGLRIASSSNNLIQSNVIGSKASGPAGALPNGVGIVITTLSSSPGPSAPSTGNTIGGAAPAGSNVISGNAADGIDLAPNSAGPAVSGNFIQGNFIGTDVSGSSAIPNSGHGVAVMGAVNNTIGGPSTTERNVISGNGGDGVLIEGSTGSPAANVFKATAATGNLVENNFIGTEGTGNLPLGNASDGVEIGGGASQNTVGVANVISANGKYGVEIHDTGTTGNVIFGNIVGLTASGQSALGNQLDGVSITDASNNIIGPGNVISGNGVAGQDAAGVVITGPFALGNQVFDNKIGTDPAGTVPIGNSLHGVFVDDGATNNVVGPGNLISGNGTLANQGVGVYLFGSGTSGNLITGNQIGTDALGAKSLTNSVIGILINLAQNNRVQGNLISGNRLIGLEIAGGSAQGNEVVGNQIGTNSGGTAAVPNGLDGIFINNAPNNTIGGTTAGAGNLISGNGAFGIQLFGAMSTGNVVVGNVLGLSSTGQTLLNPAGGIFVNTGPQSNSILANQGQVRPRISLSGFHQSHAATRAKASRHAIRANSPHTVKPKLAARNYWLGGGVKAKARPTLP